jgi:hypothetical protein
MTGKMADDLKRAIVWRNLLLNGTDFCALWHTAEGRLLKGTVLGVLEDRSPMMATYEVHCDEQWHTHRVQVERTIGGDVKSSASQSRLAEFGAVQVGSYERLRAAWMLNDSGGFSSRVG